MGEQKRTERKYPAEVLLIEIQKRCEGLIYISETDSPVTVFKAFRSVEKLEENFLKSISRNPFTPTETKTFADFFDRLIQRDSRWKDLMLFLEDKLNECAVFKVGRIQIDYYAVGLFENLPVGIYMYAVET